MITIHIREFDELRFAHTPKCRDVACRVSL